MSKQEEQGLEGVQEIVPVLEERALPGTGNEKGLRDKCV